MEKEREREGGVEVGIGLPKDPKKMSFQEMPAPEPHQEVPVWGNPVLQPPRSKLKKYHASNSQVPANRSSHS